MDYFFSAHFLDERLHSAAHAQLHFLKQKGRELWPPGDEAV